MPVRIRDKGGFAALESWQQALKSLSQEMRAMPRDMAEEAIDLTKQTFENEADPYGVKWKPLVLRSGRTLQLSGGMKSSIHAARSGKGFTIGIAKAYAGFHQLGTGPIKAKRGKALGPMKPGGLFFRSTKGVPRRPMIPFRGMPPKWSEAFQEVAEERIGAKLTKKRTGGSKRTAAGGGGGSRALAGLATKAVRKAVESLE